MNASSKPELSQDSSSSDCFVQQFSTRGKIEGNIPIICHLSIIFTRSFGLLTEPIPPAAMRSLVMIAKCLQNLANLVEFGGKEPYMEVVNPFILKNKERMVVFLDHLSSVRDKPYPDEDRVKV